WWIIAATIPALIIGYFFKDFVESYSRNAWVIATSTIVFGLLLWYADAKAKQIKNIYQLNLMSALLLGFSQVIAMVFPGTSRSGITITVG
ncbi:undecaprenyl-diphosphate phosphatase, partial [Streptomyces scabiei]